MGELSGSLVQVSYKSELFDKMCNLSAIADTQNLELSLQKLILHTMCIFESDHIDTPSKISEVISTMFGATVPDHQVSDILNKLEYNGDIVSKENDKFSLNPETKMNIMHRVNEATSLQEKVKTEWQAEVQKQFPDIDIDKMWDALKMYLAKAFLRHGIQAASFIDPSVELPQEYSKSLSSLLAESINSKFLEKERIGVRESIIRFLTDACTNNDRSKYITECADGAFNYFSIAVDPELAKRFTEGLQPLTLFCDTNFLFGVIDLHVHPLVDVSKSLIKVIDEQALPFTLQYHESTLKETQASIAFHGDQLRKTVWRRVLSKAVSSSPFISGIELKYHQQNAETGIDVDSFLKPYHHVDTIMKNLGINIYNPSEARLEQQATLLAEYNEFLHRKGKSKPYEVVNHDVIVLDCVRYLRSIAKTVSSLDLGALLLTCDYTLYSFDYENSRKTNEQQSVVLPNIFWQILRPFVSNNENFARSFADTFAIPEFRTIGSGSARACSKMTHILAGYKDFPEETAARMVSNDMFIDRLRNISDDKQFQAEVEAEIVRQNSDLIEEIAARDKQLMTLLADKDEALSLLDKQKKESAAEIARKQEEIKQISKSKEHAEEKAKTIEAKLSISETLMTEKEKEAKKSEQRVNLYKLLLTVLCSAFSIIGFEYIVYWTKWEWLREHKNSYTIQGGILVALISFWIGLFYSNLRKVWWVTILSAMVGIVISQLGGPPQKG